ncbi:MAG: undecaprenyl-phosphate glucose phosphotransferase, partial [Pirellulales bacterium]|nr:undecaprenyl-phosphate glucose phosphotransferase [Pirellulales bacterium]
PRELGVVCRAGGLLFLLTIALTFYRRDLYESRLALGIFPVLCVVGLTVARRILWRVLRFLRGRGLNHGRALIVGAGRTGRLVAKTMADNQWTGIEAVGFVDRPGKVKPNTLPLVGTVEELPRLVEEHDVDHVFVALPLSRYAELPSVYAALSDVFAEVQLVPDVPNLAGMKLRMLHVDNVGFLELRRNPHCGWPSLIKRATDLVVGSAALVLLSPLMLCLAVAVKFSSPGPVFFRQSRAGLGGRNFNMLKFRTMYLDAEKETGPVWTKANDARCTRLGRVMRRWSMDELPQLFNVLAGDMSLVGPRPERAVFIEKFRRQLPGYCQRHQVRCGMTGWAQVNGWRGNTSLRHRLRCDLYYIANWSLWLDAQIMLMTIWKGIRNPHAY